MKLIIAGSRTIDKLETIEAALLWAFGDDAHRKVTYVVSGGQASIKLLPGNWPRKYGADYFGEQWADKHGIQVMLYPANWNHYGKSAGPRRNTEMAKDADAGLVVWDGKSRGSKDMITKMEKASKPCWVYMVGNPAASFHNAWALPFPVIR